MANKVERNKLNKINGGMPSLENIKPVKKDLPNTPKFMNPTDYDEDKNKDKNRPNRPDEVIL